MNKLKTYAMAAWLIAAVLLGATWAQTSATVSPEVSVGGVGGALFSLETSASRIGSAPILYNVGDGTSSQIVAGAVGKVKEGSLYGINVSDTGRYMVTLFFTNPVELSSAYSYLNLNITIYKATASSGSWTLGDAVSGATQYITLSSARVILYVEGSTSYIVEVAGGVFYCTSTAVAANLSPSFYILVDQA